VFSPVAAAQQTGTISAAHARVITATATVNALPAAVHAEHHESVERFLLAQAHQFDPKLLATIARRISDTLNPDGSLATERDQARRRDLTITQRCDGSAQLHGELDAICAEALLTVLDTRPVPAENGQRDPRSPGQRRHDGLHDALLMLLRADLLPEAGGVAATWPRDPLCRNIGSISKLAQRRPNYIGPGRPFSHHGGDLRFGSGVDGSHHDNV
jgi:Domain of unknown function (DUF222)